MNSQLLLYLNGLTGKSLLFDSLVIVGARYFQYIVIGYALILLYRTWSLRDPDLNIRLYIQKAVSQMVWVSTSVIFAYFISAFMKVYFAIPRPFLNGITPLFFHGGYNSFPSGHATVFAALTVSMFMFHQKRGWWFFAAAIIIGICRVVAGVHYPIDILAGYIIGSLVAYIVCTFIRTKQNKYLHLFEY